LAGLLNLACGRIPFTTSGPRDAGAAEPPGVDAGAAWADAGPLEAPDAGTLTLSDIAAIAGTTTAAVSWTTNVAADSQVEFGLTASYGSATTLDPTVVTRHSVSLVSLQSATRYHFRVRSSAVTSADQTFTTEPSVGPNAVNLPTGFVGWGRLGDPSYSWATTWGGPAGPNSCLSSGGPCAYLNSTLWWSAPDATTQSVRQCLPNGWHRAGADTTPVAGGYGFTNACRNVVHGLSSGFFDKTNLVYYVFGGGGSDYAGNDVFSIDLKASTLGNRYLLWASVNTDEVVES